MDSFCGIPFYLTGMPLYDDVSEKMCKLEECLIKLTKIYESMESGNPGIFGVQEKPVCSTGVKNC